jgi:glutaconyl-CoA/methylmalonyl-CoA decarboxylase subunit delta
MDLLLIVTPADLKLGIIITLVGISVVFIALLVLSFIFGLIPKMLKVQMRKRFRKAGKISGDEECCTDISGDTNAAIALALHLYMSELHDMESNVMTIEKVSRRYSPWSSKIYGLRNLNYPK